jgi:hypothetical protein
MSRLVGLLNSNPTMDCSQYLNADVPYPLRHVPIAELRNHRHSGGGKSGLMYFRVLS